MSQTMLTCLGQSMFNKSLHDQIYLARSQTPDDNYRCPVSTPANDNPRPDVIRRANTIHVINLQYPTTIGDRQRSGRQKRGQHTTKQVSKVPLTGLQHRVIDKKADMKETIEGHWLQSLCAQPVDEIMNKYRRKSDFTRTHKLWLHTFTTPGEKSLLNVWELHNHGRHNTSSSDRSEFQGKTFKNILQEKLTNL